MSIQYMFDMVLVDLSAEHKNSGFMVLNDTSHIGTLENAMFFISASFYMHRLIDAFPE